MTPRWGAYRWVLVGVLLTAWAVRLPLAFGGSLHPDEALYAYWGRLIASGQDPWLARVPVFKPPLLPYLVAGTQSAFDSLEVGLRVPGLTAGLLTVALTAALARAQYRDEWLAGPAAIVVALSPFATQFSRTLFPDPLMVVLGVGACAAAARRRAALAGLVAGLSFAAKQTGLAWAPLAFVLLLIGERERLRAALRFFACFAALLCLVYGWDTVRAMQGAPSFWDLGISGYGGLRLIWPHEVVTRLSGWARLAVYLVASPVLNGLIVVGVPLLVWAALRGAPRTPASLADLALIGFGAALVTLHWLGAFPVWDRYLLPLAPLVAVLISRILRPVSRRAADLLGRAMCRRRSACGGCHPEMRDKLSQIIVQAGLVLMVAVPAIGALDARPPIGGDRGASQGIAEIAGYLASLPEGSVVYHHWQGWHFRYYLFEGPVFLAYWPDPPWLAADVRAFGSGETRYITFPAGEPTTRVEYSLREVGYRLREVLATRTAEGMHTFSLYRIVPLAEGSHQ